MTLDKRMESVFEMLRGSVIRGVAFSVYDKFGPQTLYSFPPAVEQKIDGFGTPKTERIQEKIDRYQKIIDSEQDSGDSVPQVIQEFTFRDYLQIAIKSVSLLIGEKIFEKDPSLLNSAFFGVLPYPDFDITAYTFFTFYSVKGSQEPKACTFSLLIDNNKRSYIYDNIVFLKTVIKETVDRLTSYLNSGKWGVDTSDDSVLSEIDTVIFDFFAKIKLAEERPFTPIASKIQLKILFAGLSGSGKSSFLLTINRKFSELLSQESKPDEEIHITNLLGTTIVKWDLDDCQNNKKKLRAKANINLYDSNLIYYFVDATKTDRIIDSANCFRMLLSEMDELGVDIPIIIILTRVDKDLADAPEIRDVIAKIKATFSKINLNYMKNFTFYETSIFNLSSVIRAFSSGISLMIPNKEVADYKLKEYAKKMDASAIIIFNENGLVISEHAIDPEYDLKHNFALKYVFESLIPQYINIYRNLDKETKAAQDSSEKIKKKFANIFKDKKNNTEIVFRTQIDSNHTILIKKFMISDLSLYVLLYLKTSTKDEASFNENLAQLIEDFQKILEIYVI